MKIGSFRILEKKITMHFQHRICETAEELFPPLPKAPMLCALRVPALIVVAPV